MKSPLDLRMMCFWTTLACALTSGAHAGVTNGGFESGLAGWTTADQAGSDGTFFSQTGTASPVNGAPVPAPPGGSKAAMTDSQGPGSHVMYQTFTVTAPVASALLVFDVFVGNRSDAFRTPSTLDFATPTLNQQARVDILPGAADPFSLAVSDVLLNAFLTNVGDPLVSGYTHHSVDITSLVNSQLNTPLMLRFSEVDNVFTFQFGVDNVDIVPEPAAWMLAIAGLLGFGWRRVRPA